VGTAHQLGFIHYLFPIYGDRILSVSIETQIRWRSLSVSAKRRLRQRGASALAERESLLGKIQNLRSVARRQTSTILKLL
jgi:hypothetical protein